MTSRRRIEVVVRAVALAFVTTMAVACGRDPAPAATPLSGTIRISGSPADASLLAALEDGFRKQHPRVSFVHALHGPEATLAGVYTGTADLALMARELREPLERMAFEWAMLDKPLPVDIALAGIATARRTAQLGVFVHKDNPLRQLSLRQLDAIYGAEHRRGGPLARNWGALGLRGTWAERPIHVHGPPVSSIEALYLRRAVLHDSRKWNPGYRQAEAEGAPVIARLEQDPDGIAFAPLRDATAGVRALALGNGDEGPFHSADDASVRSGAYPLVRSITVIPAHTHERPMPHAVRAFIAYLLSDEGQAVIAAEGGYLPLGPVALHAQRERLP